MLEGRRGRPPKGPSYCSNCHEELRSNICEWCQTYHTTKSKLKMCPACNKLYLAKHKKAHEKKCNPKQTAIAPRARIRSGGKYIDPSVWETCWGLFWDQDPSRLFRLFAELNLERFCFLQHTVIFSDHRACAFQGSLEEYLGHWFGFITHHLQMLGQQPEGKLLTDHCASNWGEPGRSSAHTSILMKYNIHTKDVTGGCTTLLYVDPDTMTWWMHTLLPAPLSAVFPNHGSEPCAFCDMYGRLRSIPPEAKDVLQPTRRKLLREQKWPPPVEAPAPSASRPRPILPRPSDPPPNSQGVGSKRGRPPSGTIPATSPSGEKEEPFVPPLEQSTFGDTGGTTSAQEILGNPQSKKIRPSRLSGEVMVESTEASLENTEYLQYLDDEGMEKVVSPDLRGTDEGSIGPTIISLSPATVNLTSAPSSPSLDSLQSFSITVYDLPDPSPRTLEECANVDAEGGMQEYLV